MTEEHIWALHDLFWMIFGILLIIGIIVLDFLFCNSSPNGFCAIRYFFTLVGTAIYNGVVNPVAKGIVWGALRMVDLIPI